MKNKEKLRTNRYFLETLKEAIFMYDAPKTQHPESINKLKNIIIAEGHVSVDARHLGISIYVYNKNKQNEYFAVYIVEHQARNITTNITFYPNEMLGQEFI